MCRLNNESTLHSGIRLSWYLTLTPGLFPHCWQTSTNQLRKTAKRQNTAHTLLDTTITVLAKEYIMTDYKSLNQGCPKSVLGGRCFPASTHLIQMKLISSMDCLVMHKPANDALIWIRSVEAGKHLKPAGLDVDIPTVFVNIGYWLDLNPFIDFNSNGVHNILDDKTW